MKFEATLSFFFLIIELNFAQHIQQSFLIFFSIVCHSKIWLVLIFFIFSGKDKIKCDDKNIESDKKKIFGCLIYN